MTTTVTIAAHLISTKEVRVEIIDKGVPVECFTLQDGETTSRAVFDEREINVREILKSAA